MWVALLEVEQQQVCVAVAMGSLEHRYGYLDFPFPCPSPSFRHRSNAAVLEHSHQLLLEFVTCQLLELRSSLDTVQPICTIDVLA
jgi:hypothetical protein